MPLEPTIPILSTFGQLILPKYDAEPQNLSNICPSFGAQFKLREEILNLSSPQGAPSHASLSHPDHGSENTGAHTRSCIASRGLA